MFGKYVLTNLFPGVIAVGLFADNPLPLETTVGRMGLFKGGGWYLLGVQSFSALCLLVWGFGATTSLLWLINKVVPIRMNPDDELLGADYVDHRILHTDIIYPDISQSTEMTEKPVTGSNVYTITSNDSSTVSRRRAFNEQT